MTTDQAAIRYLLTGNTAGLARLAAQVKQACNPTCPNCNSSDVEDNGLPASHPDYDQRCVDCGEWL